MARTTITKLSWNFGTRYAQQTKLTICKPAAQWNGEHRAHIYIFYEVVCEPVRQIFTFNRYYWWCVSFDLRRTVLLYFEFVERHVMPIQLDAHFLLTFVFWNFYRVKGSRLSPIQFNWINMWLKWGNLLSLKQLLFENNSRIECESQTVLMVIKWQAIYP